MAAARRKHLEASTRNVYLQSGQAFSSPMKPFHLGENFCLEVPDIIRRLGLFSAKVGQSFHLNLRLLSLHLQTLLKHVLLIHQLLTELLKLREHLRHLFSRHTGRLCGSRCSRISIPQSRLDHNRNPLDSNQNRKNSTLPLRYHDEIRSVWITVSCARAILSGTLARNDGRSVCTCPGLKPLSRSRKSLSTTVNVCERLRKAGYLNMPPE